MSNILKSWKTTLVGLIALVGLSYNAYLNGGFNVQDFLTLILGVGFLISKDSDQTHSKLNTTEDADITDPDNPKYPKRRF